MIRLRRKASGILLRNRIVASEACGTNKWSSKRRISLPVIPTSSSGEPQVLKLLREKRLPSGIVSSEARGTDDWYSGTGFLSDQKKKSCCNWLCGVTTKRRHLPRLFLADLCLVRESRVPSRIFAAERRILS